MALVKTRRKMWGRWQERRDFRPRWPPHAAFTEIRPRRAETHPILVGVVMDASILLPPSRAGRPAAAVATQCTTLQCTLQCTYYISQYSTVTTRAMHELNKNEFNTVQLKIQSTKRNKSLGYSVRGFPLYNTNTRKFNSQ